VSRNIGVWANVIVDDGAPPPAPAVLSLEVGTDGDCADFIDRLLQLSKARPKLFFHVSWSLRIGFDLKGSGSFSVQGGKTYFEKQWGIAPQVDPGPAAVVS